MTEVITSQRISMLTLVNAAVDSNDSDPVVPDKLCIAD